MASQFEPGNAGSPAVRAREGAEQVKEKALQRVEEVRDKANFGKEKLTERVRRVSSALRSAGDTLRDDDEIVARYAERASQRIERAADYLSSADPKQAVRDIEGFARREPAVFFGGAFLLGLAAARFLKSSQQVDQGEYDEQRWDESLQYEIEGLEGG
jgi:hypothetical protein